MSLIKALVVIIMIAIGGVLIAKTTYVSPGNVGVLIYKGGQNAKGVADVALTPGWHMTSLFTEDVQEYPIFQQTAVWTKSAKEGKAEDESITVNSAEGVQVSTDVSVSYTLSADKVPDLYVKYRSDVETIQSSFLRQSVRQAMQNTFGQYSVEDIYGPKKAEISGKVQQALQDGVGKDGFIFTQFTVNEVRLPGNIMESINLKIQSGQKALQAENDLKQVQVVAQQKEAAALGEANARLTNAKAEAEAIKIQAEAIQSQGGADYVQLKAIEKWDGSVPTQMVPGATVPFINLTK